MAVTRLSSWQPIALSLLRIIVGFTFSEHGLQKLLGLLGGHVAKPFTLPWLAGYLETFGGFLILLGLFTQPVAFILCGLMAVAYFMQHAPGGFWPVVNHGELAVLYCFVFLYLWIAGSGSWGLDALIRKKQ
jgi:putative oxidoreductase